jgi:hypothetical protein
MPAVLLNTLIQQTEGLTAREKLELARHLLGEPHFVAPATGVTPDEVRSQRMEWLKAHRTEYAGQYLAFAGVRLVGAGRTLRQAREEARRNEVAEPFLVRVAPEEEELAGGW